MGLTDLLKNVGRALTLTAALYSCGGEGSERMGCRDDRDCTNGRVCEYDQESGERYCMGRGNGVNNNNNLYSPLCEQICADGGCAGDFDLPYGPNCSNECLRLLEGCSQYFVGEVNSCMHNYDCDGPNTWVPCLEGIKRETPCNPW